MRHDAQPDSAGSPVAPDSALEASITRLLKESGEVISQDGWSRIYALIYNDLLRIARSQIRRQTTGPNQPSPTSLVSETWLRLAQSGLSVENRAHLTSLAARAMRFILVDMARRQATVRHGSGIQFVPVDEEGESGTAPSPLQLLVLEQALDRLEQVDARAAKVVELRYFGGLAEPEIATLLEVNERTVRRDWRRARAFLAVHLDDELLETRP